MGGGSGGGVLPMMRLCLISEHWSDVGGNVCCVHLIPPTVLHFCQFMYRFGVMDRIGID